MITVIPVGTHFLFATSINELSALALVVAGGGLYLFVVGFRLLARKHLVADTPTSKVTSASMGLVEISGVVSGPYTLPAAITGNPCLLYRTIAWQQGDSRRRNEWDKVAEENQHVPFFLSDGTGELLVDAQGAELDLERDFRQQFDASPLSFTALPDPVSAFLSRNGVAAQRRIRIEEWTIKPDDRLFIVGTVAENASLTTRLPATSNLSKAESAPAPEIIQLSPKAPPTTAADMTLQGKIAAALTKAGIHKPEAWAAAGISTETALQPTRQVSQIRVNEPNGPATARRDPLFNLASPIVLRKGENNPTFLISWRSRQDVIRSLSWKSMSMVFGGGGLVLLGIYVVLLQAGML